LETLELQPRKRCRLVGPLFQEDSMRRALSTALIALIAVCGCAANPVSSADAVWDSAPIARMVDSARQARLQGDLALAEKLCYAAFETVDRSALAAFDAYADLLKIEHRAEEPAVRAQSAQLHEIKAQQRKGTQPTSTYLGFVPNDVLNAYANLLQALQRPDEAQRIRSLALAYQQVQQAHFQRTLLYRQGKDPRGAC
jgi:hypothetical protein